jgi:hypothetical protein
VLWLPALDCADRLSRVSGRNKARAVKNGAVASAVLVHQTRGIGPLQLALAGATRSGSAGVGSLLATRW